MFRKRVISAVLAVIGAMSGIVRADYVLDTTLPANRVLVASPAIINWKVGSLSTSGDEVTGTFSMTGVLGGLGTLTDSSFSGGHAGVDFTGATIPPAPPPIFNMTVDLDIKKNTDGSYTIASSNASANVVGTAYVEPDERSYVFADTPKLSSFDLNLNGSSLTPAGFLLSIQNSTYWTGPAYNTIVVQLKRSDGFTPADPFTASNFFVGVGHGWDPGQYKVDMFGVSLPLPAPLAAGTAGILAVAAGSLLTRRQSRRTMASAAS